MRGVQIVAAAVFGPAGIQIGNLEGVRQLSEGNGLEVPGFEPVRFGVPRKHVKTMTRAVQLGVAAAGAALEAFKDWKSVPPERRGMYVGGSPQSGDAEDMIPAVEAWRATGDLSFAGFASSGIPLIPPLWLVKGLSNNILGYAAAQWDLQGDNGNWCDGRRSGGVAITNAIHAIAEGRVDLALAGGADDLRMASTLMGRPCAEGAAFLVLIPGPSAITAGFPSDAGTVDEGGELGAAAVSVALARRWLRGERGFEVGGVKIV